MNDFESYLNNSSNYVNREINKFINKKRFQNSSLINPIKYVLNVGGKRLRPIFLLEISKILNVKLSHAINVAISIEFMHCYSLVHDDLPAMDDDDIRRGHPTCHKKFNEATAILVGDALQCLSFEILTNTSTHHDPLVRNKLISELAKSSGINGMVEGQKRDLDAPKKRLNLNDIKMLQRLKTGELFRFSCLAGPILAGSERKIFNLFEKYSINLGIAFQIQDDLLDYEGTEAQVGKRINKDSIQGKQTFISILGFKKAKKMAKDLIDESVDLISSFGQMSEKLSKLTKLVIERNS